MSKSERWSSASSDSDVSFVLFGGEHRGDIQGSNAIHDILKERIAFLSGGKDKRGGSVITIPSRGSNAEVKSEDFKRLLVYLAGLPSNHAKDQGFSIVVDMRGSTWLTIKPVLKSLQECFPSKIHAVYIIKPEGFWERHKASSGSGKFNFEVTFCSLEGLCKYIEPSNLTSGFGGTLVYDHDQWVIMQMALEKFNFESMSLLTKLEEIHEGLIHQDYADDLVALREQVKHNQHVRKWIIKAPIETLEEEGAKLLEWITENKIKHGDAASEDWKATSARIRSILENLHGKRQMLKDSWHVRKHRLDQCIQYHLFQLDADKMRQWIKESQLDLVSNFSEVGTDDSSATELQQEHQNIENSCNEISENIKKILAGAEKLLQSGHYEADLIESIAGSLEQEWKQFAMDISERGNLLACSVGFHRKSEEFLRRVRTWQDQLHDDSYSTLTDIDQLSQMLIQESNIKKEIDTSYEAVSAESKQLLEALQKPLLAGDERDSPEFSEAASHVMELFLNVHEHHRQLGILWDAKQSGLRELIHMLTLDQDITQVIKWIDEHGEPFLDKHTDVGMTAEKAEALLKRHEEFEAIAKNTYTNADQIREAIKQLQDSGECRPHEVEKRTQYFDKRVQNFVKRVEKRKQILEQAVSFYSSTKAIHEDVDKVKAQLEIEELSDDPDDIAKVLLKLRHECERALENVNQSINDGRSIIEHVTKASATQDVKTSGSCEHLEEIITELEAKKNVLEMAWMRRREQMELWQQLWEFERDGEQVKNHLESCEAELEKGGLADDLNGAKQMLNSFQEQLKAIDTLSLRTFCKGEELIDLLRHSDVELRVRNPNTPETIDAHHHIQNLLEFLHNQRRSFLEFAESRRRKLEHRLALKQLEADTKQAIGCIRNGENMLLSNINPGFSLAEAKDSIMEYDQFKTAMEKTSQRVASIRSRADGLVKQNHPKPDQLMKCSDLVFARWQQLMKKASEKQQVVMSSFNFFKTSEQVSSLLQKVLKEYKIGDDPCSQYSDLELRDRCSVITLLLENHAREREEIAKGHEAVYGFADTFLKNVSPTAENGGTISAGTLCDANREKMEQQVKEISELIRGQKKFALDLWNVKNTVLGQCKDFLDFETNAKQALEWIHDEGECYLSSNVTIPESEDEAKARYENHQKFTEMSEEIKERVKCLLQEADELYKQSCFHSDGITQWATAVDKRFKDFSSRMTKYLNQLEAKLGFPITKYSENDEEMPDVSVLSQSQQHPQNLAIREKTLNLRELSKDSGIHELMEEEKRKSARRKEFIMNELLHTERTYVADLKCIIQNYMEVMVGNPNVPPGLVSKEDVIFGNMKGIYEFHQSVFLSALEKYETHPEDVGECFAEKAEEFKMYVFYCKNKTLSNNLLIEHGGTFFSDLQASYNHGLSIAAYLIKPVQRITKYQLLLKDLLTCCEGSEKSLQAGLEVMLGVPRQANDEMSISLIRGYDEHLHCLGRILLQDVFFMWDAKLLRRKGKERHLFLFQQALLVTKEVKDVDGKVVYLYKYKLKCAELGVTEHIAEDGSKFAIWTGLPPNNDDRKIVKANSLEVKQNWVKQLRSLQQQFQFGVLRSRTMSTCSRSPWKNPDRESGVVDDDRVSWDFEYGEKACDEASAVEITYYSIENYQKLADDEVSLKKGQFVEVIESPANSPRWKVRFISPDSEPQIQEGWIPSDVLRRQEEPRRLRRNSDGSLCSSEDSNSLSSCNDLSPAASLYNSPGVLNGATSPPVRRRAKSTGQFGTLRMKPWRRDSMKKSIKSPQSSPVPRNTRISGGGSKKLQALLGASENDIDLLIKTNSSPISASPRKNSGSLEEGLVLPEEPSAAQVIAENGNSSTEIIHDEHEEICESNESLLESSESLLNDDETGNGVIEENGEEEEDLKDGESEEDKEAVALKKRMYVIKELIHTEQDYVKDLEAVVEGYIPELSKDDIPEELKGKEREIFGNMKQILEWHKSFFCKELEKCEDAPEKIGSVFLKAAKRLEMYIHYCQKKPKSEGLVREFEDSYFQELKTRLGHRLALSDYLIKPVQRIMKYQLLLKDILKYTERANLDSTDLKSALDIMRIIPKKANDMMNVGMLEGYCGNVKAQGDLILQDIVLVADHRAKTKPAKRRVFVFEQMIIFSEPFERKKDWTVFIYRHSIKTNFMGVTETYGDDPCKFAIWTHQTPSEIYVMKTETPEDKAKWIKTLKQLLEHLKQFANALVNPIEYQGGNADPLGLNCVTTSEGQVTPPAVTEENSRNTLAAPASVVRRHSSATKTMSAPTPNQVRHFSLIPLHTAKTLEGLTGAFSEARGKDKYVANADYKAKAKDQISVKKGDIVYVVSSKKHDKKWLYGHVAGNETLGLVPARVLRKDPDENHVNEDDVVLNGPDKSKLTRKHSFPNSALRRVTQRKSKQDFYSNISSQLRESIEKFHSDFTDQTSVDGETGELSNGSVVKEGTSSPRCRLELRDAVINRPNTLRLSCEVLGNPIPSFQWEKDSKPLTASERIKITEETHRSTLEITNSAFEDSGVYTCTAVNDHGQVTTSCIAQVRDKPSSPSKPTVTEITSSSVIVKWNPPASDGNSAITAYTVECKETGVSHWQAPVPFVSTTSTVVDDLTPGSVYQFRVSANNVVGISKPSPPTDPVTLDVGNGKSHRECVGKDAVTWKADIDEFHNVYAELGRGRYSVVKKCVDKISGKEYAAKFIKKRMCSSQDVEREVVILRRLKHPNINAYVDSFENDKNWILVLELLPNGRLFDSIVVANPWTEKEAVGFVKQILEAVQHLHDCRVAHLDLKPENLLLDSGPIPKVKLVDFGSAFTMSNENIIPDLLGNPEFAAPEIIRGLPASIETDVWSIGVIVHVMLTGVSPFYDEHLQTMCDNISKVYCDLDAEYMSNISTEAKAFIKRLLIREQWRRPECSDCLDMRWMKMIQPRSPFPAPVTRLNTSRLASFNARRRKNQHEVTDIRPLLLTEKGESNV